MSEPRPQQVDGWWTADPERFAFLRDRAPRWRLRDQLRVDALSWKVWLLWTISALCFANAFLAQRLPPALAGLAVAGAYGWMCFTVVRGLQRSRRLVAIVLRFDEGHPLYPEMFTGAFLEEAGPARGRALCHAWLAERARRADGTVRALVSFDPGAELSEVMGVSLDQTTQ